MKVSGREFSTNLFDKRDNFLFPILRMPHLSSTIPSKIFYTSVEAEICRIARITTTSDAFRLSSELLINRLAKQGGNVNLTKS